MPQPFSASGQISPRRFVKVSGDFKVAQCGAGDQAVGISQSNVYGPPGTLYDDGFAANPSATPPRYELLVYQIGETCLLDTGKPVTAGNRLKADLNGMGIPTTADGDFYGAIAAEGCAASGATIRVTVTPGQTGA